MEAFEPTEENLPACRITRAPTRRLLAPVEIRLSPRANSRHRAPLEKMSSVRGTKTGRPTGSAISLPMDPGSTVGETGYFGRVRESLRIARRKAGNQFPLPDMRRGEG
jgi:hypothetical protein